MTVTVTIITALIAGGISFLLGWVVCKAVFAQASEPLDNDAAGQDEKAALVAVPVSADVTGLQGQIQVLQHDKAKLNAKNSRY